MKVLVIPAWYPIGKDKLMGIYHKEFAQALNKNGIRADILYIYRQGISKLIKCLFMKKKEVLKEEDLTVYIYKMLDVSKLNFQYQIKKYVKKLDKSFKEYLKTHDKPDVIHAMVTVPAGYAASVLGKKYNIPVVVTEHKGNFERFFVSERLIPYTKFVLENATYSTVSNHMRELVLKYHNQCFIIPNQVDTKIFKNNVKRKITGTFRLVSLCALREGKNLDIAFKAIRQLIDKGMDIHYDIIGDGFKEDYYKEACTKEGLDKYVTFLGRLPKKEAAKVFLDEHALLISSELESFAIPGIEALASGLPVIATKCKGPEEYIDEKTGIICEVNDPDSMAEAIEKLYKNYSSYKKEYLEAKAKLYDEDAVIKEAIKVYKYAIKENNAKE